jgi:2-polyprenyl-6-methoxyphenol hydroxylase-like FAD-dependent oxidoreductase
MRNGNVLISGASVAGPALAYWLRQYGCTPTVVERAPAPRPGGHAIDLRGTAREVAERMGIMGQVRAAHTGARAMAYVNAANKKVAVMPSDVGESGGVIADIEILRSDLVRILYDATRQDVEYVFDDSITALVQRPDGVEVTFARGAARTFDLVVGADGLHSKVRSLAFGPESTFVRDGGQYMAIFPADPGIELDGWELFHNMPRRPGDPSGYGRMAGIYPMRDRAQCRAMLAFSAPPLPRGHTDLSAQKQLLADTFDGEGWLVPRLLEHMWQTPEFYLYRPSLVHLDRWSAGRAVLLGDASFAGSIGQGTSMALVGAYVLAGELAAAQGDHRVAFAAYEDELRAYVTDCQKPIPGGLKGFLPPTRTRIWLRNQFIRAIAHSPWRRMFTGDLEKSSNAVTLKDYPVVQETRSKGVA